MNRLPYRGLSIILSGGQTGVDRAALDWAISSGIEHGGWCPKGRRAEDGVIHARYRLRETHSAKYAQRTKWNVRDSDGTLILNVGVVEGGTLSTIQFAEQADKPYRLVDCDSDSDVALVTLWLSEERIATLNIAGPREEQRPGSYALTRVFLDRVLATL
ncbi:MAG: putative molybdenum carrier protein [Gammaproteobacteria bacterium]|nr:putative molybdenum carrier protein [Gammaproteobacteria bacterium]